MTELTLAEEVMLIALDDETGAGRSRPGLDLGVAGAVLMELTALGRLELGAGSTLELKDTSDTGVAHLDAELGKIAAEGGMKVAQALRKLRRSATEGAAESLVERGVLREEKARVLGVVPRRRYPEVDAAPEAEIRARLNAAVLDGAEPDERTAVLVSVLDAARLRRQAFPGADRAPVKKRMEELAEGQWVGTAVRKEVVRQIAIIAAATSGGAH
ncbi:GOLPH3/VPS74 family protein [Pseudonocardia spinosispora]|uniref:GOLPH3/VPS74 family protein n=1 Tax=Pseudonocardia spinosispora TaxID=103441 RepID=UPI0004140060|nr:GPP34 family phosphoprotein [Pseudonocardia spinosispora]